MAKKKKKLKPLKPFCYYCGQVFKDESVLVQHQKAKHFKCQCCNKKLSTVIALSEHMLQLHQQVLTKVPNAIPGRDSIDLDIYGMENVPEKIKWQMRRIQNGLDPEDEEEQPAKRAKVSHDEGGSEASSQKPAGESSKQPAMGAQPQLPGGVPPPFQQHLGAPGMNPYGQSQPWNAYGAPQRLQGIPGCIVPPPFGNQSPHYGNGLYGAPTHGRPPGQPGGGGGFGRPLGPMQFPLIGNNLSQGLHDAPVPNKTQASAGFALSAAPTAAPPAGAPGQAQPPQRPQRAESTTHAPGPAQQQQPPQLQAAPAAFAAGAVPGQAVQQALPVQVSHLPPKNPVVNGTNYYYGDNDVSAEEKRAAMAKYRLTCK